MLAVIMDETDQGHSGAARAGLGRDGPSLRAAVLGVEQSVTGRRWVDRETDGRMALALAQRLRLPEVVGRVLAARGVALDDAESFLNPTLRAGLPDPSHLKDLDKAARRVVEAIHTGEPIVVFGDYDVDGATSAALMSRFLDTVGARVSVYIPDRLSEGYGPNPEALVRLREQGASLVVTVDCGTTAFSALEAARDAGLDVVVVDHHESEPRLPPAVAVVNPNRLDEDSPHGQLAAVGVTFLLVVGVNRLLREEGWYVSHPEPDLRSWLDLVALGTICDVVPLTGVNRTLVTQGLKVMARRTNPGIRALADVAGVDEPPGTYHAGYLLGPRINAGGRVGEAHLGARLLRTDDEALARDLARRLDAYNRERRDIEAKVMREAFVQVEQQDRLALTFVFGAWHPGVVGIVASRLVERLGRPACVVGMDERSGQGSGSCRSIHGVDLGAAVIAARQAGLLVKGGGHTMAAGFTVESDQLEPLRQFLDERVSQAMTLNAVVPTLRVDGALDVGGASLELVAALRGVGPFGAGNPEPRFVFPHVRLSFANVVGDSHVRCSLENAVGTRLDAISFRSVETALGQTLLACAGGTLHVAGRLRENTWRGRASVQLLIDDAAMAIG